MSLFIQARLWLGKVGPPFSFGLGLLALLGLWLVLYGVEALFTEAHLAGYYCCVTEADLPAAGTWERTLSDFFYAAPGRHLPSLIFVTGNAGLFALHLGRGQGKRYWWLPFVFVAFNALYLAAAIGLVGLSWSISNWVLGPQISAYKGYQRTWYGLVLHFGLWAIFFTMLWKLPANQHNKNLQRMRHIK